MLAGVDVRLDRALLLSVCTAGVGGLFRLNFDLEDGVATTRASASSSCLDVLALWRVDRLPIIMAKALGAAADFLFSVLGLCRTGSETAGLSDFASFLLGLAAARLLDLEDWRVDESDGAALLI